MSDIPSIPAPGGVLQRRLVEAGLVACAIGLLVHRTWQALPAGRFGESLLLAGLWAALSTLVHRCSPLRRGEGVLVVGLALLVLMAGPLPVVAVLLMAAAALAIGTWFVSDAGVAFVVGLAVVAAVAGALAPLPVHRVWTYAPLLLALVAIRRRAVIASVADATTALRAAIDAAPRAAFLALLALGLASAGAWLPTMQYDDLAYHLGLPWQLMRHGRYALDASSQVWALAPWAGDVLHGIAQLLAGREARGALDAAWLVASGALVVRAADALGAGPALRWAALGLLATLPPMAALAGGMQTELPAVAAMLALLVLALAPAGTRGLLAVAVLAGLLAALKPMHLLAGIALVGLALARHARWARLCVASTALLAFLVVGGSSYAYAIATCGNPFTPLFNATFRSPCFAPVDFADTRWQALPGMPVPWSMTFLTHRYLEGWDGGLGLLLVACAGALLVALIDRCSRGAAVATIVALGVPMLVLPYARYVVPGLALLVPVAVATVARLYPERRAALLLATLAVVDLAFQANAGWLLHTGGVKRALAAAGRDPPLLQHYVPERLVIDRIRTQWPQAVVLDLGAAAHAELAGRGRTTTWYAPALHEASIAADADPSGARWATLLREQRIDVVLLRAPDATDARRAGLRRAGAHRAMTLGNVECWRLPPPGPR